MFGKKIVVKYNDGTIMKGYTTDFNPAEDFFHLYPVEEDLETAREDKIKIDVNNLKAIFFVKTFLGNKDYKKIRTFNGYESNPPPQRRIIIVFKDGENFYGTTYSYSPDKSGFFAFPIDPLDNNDRVFIPRTSLEKVHVKKFGSEDFDIYIYEN
ncbi:MAG: hypothetical protein PHO73_04570 [Atribacterota bacterium]|jgi:hypothetical protein|nr:hypothetical protein [Atribacterota bacterium]